MKVTFGIGVGVGLGILAGIPAPGYAQCFSVPRRAVAQPYYPAQVPYAAPQTQQSQYRPTPQPYQPGTAAQPANFNVPPTQLALPGGDVRRSMRDLWGDHVVLTRLYLVSAMGGLPDKDAAAERLLKNQTDIGNALKPFYGDATGDKMAGLLKDHVLLVADTVAATKASDVTKKSDLTTKLQANADDIATTLAAANPRNWSDRDLKTMMREHLDLLSAEIDARNRQDWNGEEVAFEKSKEQIRHMADMLATGIVNQFPDRFRR